MVSNAEVAKVLEEFATLLELTGADGFRVNAHHRAARGVEGLTQSLAALAADKASLTAIDGIGPKLADKLVEIVRTGTLAELETLRVRVPAGLLDILRVPGLGPKSVKAMWDANITDTDALKRAIADGSLLKLPRMGEKAVAKIKDSLAFFDSSATRTHLGKAAAVAHTFVTALSALPGVARIEPAGSLRRGKETIGDIDILVAIADDTTDRDLATRIAARFCSLPGVIHVIAQGSGKSSVLYALEGGLGRWKPTPQVASTKSAELTASFGSQPAAPRQPSIQVDLRILPESSFGSALMYFTGSKEHNVRLRERSLAMGYTLNEWGLFPVSERTVKVSKKASGSKAKVSPASGSTNKVAGDVIYADSPALPAPLLPPQDRGVKPLASASEEQVFAMLGLPWIPPEAREDRGELNEAGPWDLVTVADIRAELHAHTTASDGLLSILELAEEALRRGFHTIAVTDHSQSSSIAGGLKPDRLRAHIAAVREANSKINGITILAGSEVDILTDGSLDYDDKLLAELDVVVASPHAALSQDPAAATARLLRAISHPRVHIIGHPTGRLLLRRAGLSPDMPRLIAAAKEHDVALEINSHWMRLDLRDTHARAAILAGVKLAINCDDHERSDFDNLQFGVATARRAWATPADCINAWPAEKLHRWLQSKR